MATDSWALAVDEQEAAAESVLLSRPMPMQRRQMKKRKRTELPSPYSTN
ncbi:DDX19B isoform 13 [Pongo abelii]|uniref:DDX19B isoform 12 n=1 Tax=Pongo abelii TaxID=9601 RepID=A0A2J8VW71_PONAB|nr:DDX19B isoform 12 [Pongo abelii]PNJ61791.1 DDX19B isoform 13 [Pongo abelii]